MLGVADNLHSAFPVCLWGFPPTERSLPGSPCSLLAAGMLCGMHKVGMLQTRCLQG